MLVVDEELGDGERVVQIALADEEVGGTIAERHSGGGVLRRAWKSMMLTAPTRASCAGVLEQRLDLAGRHVDERLGELEHPCPSGRR